MNRAGARGTGRPGIRIWIAMGLIALAWHAVWFLPRPPHASSGPPAPPPPRLFFLKLDGSERAALTPIFYSLDPEKTDPPDAAAGIPARPALPALPDDPVARSFEGPAPGAGSVFPGSGISARGLTDALDRAPTPEPPEIRSVRWRFEADPPGAWDSADLREAPPPESAGPDVAEIRGRIDFGPEGVPLSVSLDPDPPAIRGALRDGLLRWRLRPELAPGSRSIRLRPGPPAEGGAP